MNKLRTALLLSTTAAAFCLPNVAFAQTAGPADAAATEAGEEESDDIVVTAQRREENLQDVPQSVTAVTGEALDDAGVRTTRDLQLVTPGLRIEAFGTYVQPAIRGVTTGLTGGQEANVATYIDGVYQASLVSAFYNLPDVRQIEVLKGPQGTLFGRNATGGAILIHTIQPDLNDPTGKVTLGYGRFGTLDFKGYASIPIIQDRLAVGFSGFYEATDGWKRNLARGGEREGASIEDLLLRGKIRFSPWDGANFVLTGNYSNRHDNSVLKGTPWKGNLQQAQFLIANGLPYPKNPWEFATDVDARVKVKTRGISLRGDIEVGPGTLTTTTAYNKLESRLITDADLSVVPNGTNVFDEVLRSFSQEVVYATDKIGAFSGVVGLFYFKSRGGFEPGFATNFVTGNSTVFWTRNDTKAWAAFGEVNFDITERLVATGGLRYSHETKRAAAAILTNNFVEPSPIPFLGEKTWDSFTPRVSLLYKVTDDVNVYGTFSKGFKGGTFNASSLQLAPVDPEKITSYEAGIKTQPARGVTLNAAAFLYKYADLQVPTISQVGVRLVQFLTNAAQAKIYGLEVSGSWRVNRNFNLTAGGTYLHARYTSFPSASDNVPTGVGGNTQVPVNATGNFMTRSPTWTANLTGAYKIPTSAGEFEFSGSMYYSSRTFFDVSNRVTQPAYATINAALAWRPNDSPFEARAWVKNLTNHAVISATTLTAAYDSIDYAPPRQYGIEATFKF